jgi:hypothetical protein
VLNCAHRFCIKCLCHASGALTHSKSPASCPIPLPTYSGWSAGLANPFRSVCRRCCRLSAVSPSVRRRSPNSSAAAALKPTKSDRCIPTAADCADWPKPAWPRPCQQAQPSRAFAPPRALIGAHCEWLSSGSLDGEAAQRAHAATRGHSQCGQTGGGPSNGVSASRTANDCGHIGGSAALWHCRVALGVPRVPQAADLRPVRVPGPHIRQPAWLPPVRPRRKTNGVQQFRSRRPRRREALRRQSLGLQRSSLGRLDSYE